jgi:hypothetical protein
MTAKIADDLGRLFEVGFNIGILSYIEQNKIKNRFGTLYRHELKNLKFSEIKKIIINQVSSKLDREIAATWCQFFLQKGFLCGLNFFREYIISLGCDQKLQNLEILYYQCSFHGNNSMGTHEINDQGWFRQVFSQFQIKKLELPQELVMMWQNKIY